MPVWSSRDCIRLVLVKYSKDAIIDVDTWLRKTLEVEYAKMSPPGGCGNCNRLSKN